jgi:hypothetical protein
LIKSRKRHARWVAGIGEERNKCGVMVGKPERKRPPGRARHK